MKNKIIETIANFEWNGFRITPPWSYVDSRTDANAPHPWMDALADRLLQVYPKAKPDCPEVANIDTIISEVEDMHPYKEAGNKDGYSEYAEGWTDACDILGERIKRELTQLHPDCPEVDGVSVSELEEVDFREQTANEMTREELIDRLVETTMTYKRLREQYLARPDKHQPEYLVNDWDISQAASKYEKIACCEALHPWLKEYVNEDFEAGAKWMREIIKSHNSDCPEVDEEERLNKIVDVIRSAWTPDDIESHNSDSDGKRKYSDDMYAINKAELISSLAESYKINRLCIALVCDEILDGTGELLGEVRKAALKELDLTTKSD